MNPEPSQPALICPYTLIEEEALAWSIILCGQAILLHPFPLPLPPTYLSLVDQGRLQIRSSERTREEIRIKDKNLRAVQTYIAGLPDQAFLKYLKGLTIGDSPETQEEIIVLLKGGAVPQTREYPPAVHGQILLCLIHGWMMQKWEMDTALDKVEALEKKLTSGWQENSEGTAVWPSLVPVISRKNDPEIPCPLSLSVWQELKENLAPEPYTLFTTQWWVWAEHFGQDPEEAPPISIPLPDLGSISSSNFQKQLENLASPKSADLNDPGGLLKSFMASPLEKSIADFQKGLSGLGLPPAGRYNLILPPVNPAIKGFTAHEDLRGKEALFLLSPGPSG